MLGKPTSHCKAQSQQGERHMAESQGRAAAHVNTVRLPVGPEHGVGGWDLDDLDLVPLGIWCAGQSVVSIQ